MKQVLGYSVCGIIIIDTDGEAKIEEIMILKLEL